MDVIDKIFGTHGWTWDQTVTYENPAAPWLSYLFYPEGRSLTLANMQSIFNVLQQKYLIFAAENCDGLFVFQATTARAKDYDITDELLSHETVTVAKRLMWRDEAMILHYSGFVSSPIHNLGYIDSLQGAPPTNTPSPKPFRSSKLPVHLKYRTGDVARLGTSTNYFQGRIKVTEVFDPKSTPSWHVVIEPLCWFTNTEGGALPSTIEAAAPYTPLHTGYFTRVLSASDNNIQAAMETLDDHTHDAAYAPLGKGVTNGDAHDHSGGDGAQIDHTTLANKGTNTHAQIDTFLASKAQSNGLASLDPNTCVASDQMKHAIDVPGVSAYATDEHFFSAPPWTWINDPTGTNGLKQVGNHFGKYQADDANLLSIFYRSVTVSTNKTANLLGCSGNLSELGIHMDDGTLNNYTRFGLCYLGAGTLKIVKRVCTGGVLVSTDLIASLPQALYGLHFTLFTTSIFLYYYKDIFIPISCGGTITQFFTPARIGFYFSKQSAGSARDVGIARWMDSFS
jgi:hypothetical protein